MSVQGSYFDVISAKNPSVWFRFNETAGTPTNSGSISCSLTATGSPLLNENTDVDGRSIYLPRGAGYTLSNFPSFSIFDDKVFSIEFWIKTTTADTNVSSNQMIFNISQPLTGSGTINYEFYLGGTTGGNQGRMFFRSQMGIMAFGTNRIDDNQWHHIALTQSSGTITLYLDGGFSNSQTYSLPSYDLDDSSSVKRIGVGGGNYAGFQGFLDEFAIYNFRLTDVQVNENFVAGTAVYFNDIAQIVSAEFVEPTWVNNTNPTADVMTASSASGDHYVSNYDVVPPLESYLESLTLDQYIKFTEYHSARNYALNQSSNQPAITFYGNADNVIDGGLQLSGVIKFVGSGTNGRIIMNQTAVNNELTDGNFVLGCWLKIPSISDSRNIITSYDTQNPPQGIRLDLNSAGQLQFQIENNQVHTITGTDVIDDDQWHFVVLKVSNSNYSIWVDDVQDASGTFNGSYPGSMVELGFGSNNIGSRTGFINLSHFFIGSTSNVTTGILTNIYNYGQEEIHAKAIMNAAVAKFDSSYNDKVVSLNPTLDFRLNEGSGANIVTDSVKALVANIQGTARTSGVATRNNRGINFTDLDTRYVGTYAAPSGTFSSANKQSISVFFKTNGVQDDWDRICSTGMESLNGLSIETSPSGRVLLWSWTDDFYLEIRTASDTVVNGQWHHVVGVKDGDNAYIYFDGKLAASDTMQFTLSDTIRAAIGGIGVVEYNSYDYSAARNTTIDEFAIFPTALSAQEAFELYQSISMEMDTTASASLPMPTFEVGTGIINVAEPMTASAEQLDPSISAPFLEAFAEFLMPNFGTTVVIDSNYGHTAFEADALFHDPQFNIGDEHSADHMDASALMVDPLIITPGSVTAPVLIAGDAELVHPGIITITGAQVFADAALASSFLPLPPAYVQLSDDQWFATLLEGHADKAIEPIQATLSNLPNQSTTDIIKGGFLTFFNEFTSDLTTTTQINSIQSEIPAYYFDREDTVRYDNNGNIVPLDTTKNVSPARAPRGTGLTTPRMGVGYFDDYERKAVRIENIEFPFPGTSAQFSDRFYNLEFSIKTIKKDQVLAYGYKTQTYGSGRRMGVVGLSDGKIYLTEDATQRYSSGLRNLFSLSAPHPKNFINRAQYLLSKKDVADGQWHHIIIQYGYDDRRTQIWIDGKLDRQLGVQDADGRSNLSLVPGSDGTNTVRPYTLGFNSNDPMLYSDFETSGWNFYPGRFLTSQQVLVNYLAYLKYEPVKAEPMLGTVTIGENNIGQGNKSRMLLLYWWRNPVGQNQFVNTRTNPLTTGYDGNNSPWQPEDLIDDPKKPPISWEGWDVFPIGVVAPATSDIIKINNIGINSYIDNENGRTRYLNLQEDLNLSQFDAIMFANYPTTSAQLDEYVREESVDTYFGVKEKDNYSDFLKSLRLAVDSGMSLLVQFDQLARDLKIYDRVERIPVFNEGISDKRAFWHTNNTDWDVANNIPNKDEDDCRLPIDLEAGAYFEDRYDNMRHRVINTVELLTDDPTYIFTDRAYYQNSDIVNFGGPNRFYERFEYKIQGLQPGDEFVFGNPSNQTSFGNTRARQRSMLAIPFENVLAGKIITAQPEKYWKGDEYVDNPYKNYAHSIALLPGDVLDGKGIGGKIFVCISEVFWDETPEYRIIDLYSDYWIDISYDLGFLGEVGSSEAIQKRNDLKDISPSKNPSYVTPTGKTTEHYNWATYWSRNDNFAFTQIDRGQDYSGVLGLLFENSIKFERVPSSRKALQSFTRRRDQLGRFASGSGGNGQLFFQFKIGRLTETMNVYVPNLFSRAFWWLSERERPTGLVQRPQGASASAFMPEAVAIVDKEINENALPMIASANIGQNISGTVEITDKSVTITTLPLTANADIVELGKRIFADSMNATTLAVDPGIFTYALEEVVLTIANTEAVVYLRGDKIT